MRQQGRVEEPNGNLGNEYLSKSNKQKKKTHWKNITNKLDQKEYQRFMTRLRNYYSQVVIKEKSKQS